MKQKILTNTLIKFTISIRLINSQWCFTMSLVSYQKLSIPKPDHQGTLRHLTRSLSTPYQAINALLRSSHQSSIWQMSPLNTGTPYHIIDTSHAISNTLPGRQWRRLFYADADDTLPTNGCCCGDTLPGHWRLSPSVLSWIPCHVLIHYLTVLCFSCIYSTSLMILT